jgi:hypothetical protein
MPLNIFGFCSFVAVIELSSAGQAWLYAINGKNYEELFIAFEQLSEDLMIVVSAFLICPVPVIFFQCCGARAASF